jgi:hypothetical protein
LKLRILLVGSLFGVSSVAFAAPAHACMGPVCDAINVVCGVVMKGNPCVK